MFFFLSVSVLTLTPPPLPPHAYVKHAVRFVPFAFPWLWTKVKHREKINQWWRTLVPTTHVQHLHQHTRAHMDTQCASSPPSIWRWGELKYKDGRCSTSSENCNFCSPASLGWQEIFHLRCHRCINKTSGAECSPSLSYTHTNTQTVCTQRVQQPRVQMQKYNSVHEYRHTHTNTTAIFLLNHMPASAMKISCCI